MYPEIEKLITQRVKSAQEQQLKTIVQNMIKMRMWTGTEAALLEKMRTCAELKHPDDICQCNHMKRDGRQCKRPGAYRGYCKQHVGDHLDELHPVQSKESPIAPRRPAGFFET